METFSQENYEYIATIDAVTPVLLTNAQHFKKYELLG
jgi:hypothetical protein